MRWYVEHYCLTIRSKLIFLKMLANIRIVNVFVQNGNKKGIGYFLKIYICIFLKNALPSDIVFPIELKMVCLW